MLNSGECGMATIGEEKSAQGEEIVEWVEIGHGMLFRASAIVHHGANANEDDCGGSGTDGNDGGKPEKESVKPMGRDIRVPRHFMAIIVDRMNELGL
jgi:hypothetical protein